MAGKLPSRLVVNFELRLSGCSAACVGCVLQQVLACHEPARSILSVQWRCDSLQSMAGSSTQAVP